MGSLICLERFSYKLSNLNIFGNKKRPLKKNLLILGDDKVKYQNIFNIKEIKVNFWYLRCYISKIIIYNILLLFYHS